MSELCRLCPFYSKFYIIYEFLHENSYDMPVQSVYCNSFRLWKTTPCLHNRCT